jgi:2-hydroxychromene-2-carboxylate isomerase
MHSVWAKGIDAGTDRGLRKIVEKAGLPWNDALGHLDTDDWVPIEQDNRKALDSLQLWGVPSYNVGSTAIWGQDRLWQVEEAIR